MHYALTGTRSQLSENSWTVNKHFHLFGAPRTSFQQSSKSGTGHFKWVGHLNLNGLGLDKDFFFFYYEYSN